MKEITYRNQNKFPEIPKSRAGGLGKEGMKHIKVVANLPKDLCRVMSTVTPSVQGQVESTFHPDKAKKFFNHFNTEIYDQYKIARGFN